MIRLNSCFTVAYCLVGLSLIFLLILMNKQIHTIICIYFLFQNVHLSYLFLTLQALDPIFSWASTPTSRGNASVKCGVYHKLL